MRPDDAILPGDPGIEAAEVVLPCTALADTLRFFSEELGFRLDSIFPADDPAVAVVSGHGLRLRLERGSRAAPGLLRLRCADPARVAGGDTTLVAPNGTRVELVAAAPRLELPPLAPSFVVSKLAAGEDGWGVGRAGMRYRDLIPDRQGGRFIASHIRIRDGGPVPDSVHYHQVRFQMIYCARGWVDLLYEDQGPRFRLAAGDCVLQPPEIRHRVVESSPGLEVIELACPASHLTCLDHQLALPTQAATPDREFAGQRFVRHQHAAAMWQPWRLPGVLARDTGIAAATFGLADVQVLRPDPASDARLPPHRCDAELAFRFLLAGAATLVADGHPAQALAAGDAFVIPRGLRHGLEACSPELELLAVTVPADAVLAA